MGTKVYAPNSEYSGLAAGIQFANGEADVDASANPGAMAYFRRAGYGIGERHPAHLETPAPFQPAAPAEIRGPESRDAAVYANAGGPVSDAYLPPTNAGDAEPHGPLVVSPGLHAVPPAPIRPGEVYVDDVARQESEETELAAKVLVGEEPATIAAGIGPDGDASDADETDRPAASATKAAWVEYAVSHGADRDAVEDMTKAQIQKAHG